MSTSELADVEALLERVLPDPSGFAQRVLDQLMGRLSGSPTPDQPDLVLVPERGSTEELTDHNLLLAAALGACDCWGADPGCPVCQGTGASGWTEPDPALFAVYVTPAVARARGPGSRGTDRAGSRDPADLPDQDASFGEPQEGDPA